MAFQKVVKGTILMGGGALATVLGLSQFAHYRRKQVSSNCTLKCGCCLCVLMACVRMALKIPVHLRDPQTNAL